MKKIYLSLAILAGIGLAGCNDSFLEHAPVTSLTENNAFRSYDNFKSFAWPCYEIFKDNNIANTINGTGQGSCYAGDMNAVMEDFTSAAGELQKAMDEIRV